MIKYVIGGLLVIALAFGIYMEVTGWGEINFQAKLKEALAKVTTLQKEKSDLDKNWMAREKQLMANRDQLLVKVTKLEKERVSLNETIAKLRKQREDVVVPTDPAGLCPEFLILGYKSCTRVTKDK